ncbi:hypothetical protein HHI36_021836 [Cryptolaemus montrouzieri]
MENYMEYKIMGSVKRIRMKPNCIPTKFECQTERKRKHMLTFNEEQTIKKKFSPIEQSTACCLDKTSNSECNARLSDSDITHNLECNVRLTDQNFIRVKEEPVEVKAEPNRQYLYPNDSELTNEEEGYYLGQNVRTTFNSFRNFFTKTMFKKKLHELISEMHEADQEDYQNRESDDNEKKSEMFIKLSKYF